ncbi:hypothetical protein RhiJN_22176 [Ceratobasidium sp. AG-Ba]|nr:hypothetical protein RhiJN_22176 [Ceratobasidium sp. AG-Ba]
MRDSALAPPSLLSSLSPAPLQSPVLHHSHTHPCAARSPKERNTAAAVLHWVSAIYDCEDPKCNKSSKHPDNCRTHNTCTMEYGPDIQKITAMNYEPCDRCKAYFAAGGKPVRR